MTRLSALVAGLAVLLGACAPQPATSTAQEPAPTPAAAGDGLVAVTTVYPLAWMAEQIAPTARVEFLGARGSDPHDLELTPANRALLETADVVLYIGDLGFQPQVEDAVAASTGVVVSLVGVAGEDRHRALGPGGGDDHDHADEDGHATDGTDPHLWLDLEVMADAAVAIGEAFAAADPARTDAYTASAAAAAADLETLRADLEALFSDCRSDEVLVSHEAYRYLLEPFGIAQVGISGAGGHADASPQRLAELTAFAREHDLTTVLAEPVEGRADAEALAAEAGLQLAEIHPLGAVTPAQAERGYLDLVREQADTFAEAAGCG